MKKFRLKGKFRAAFWVLFLIGCFWIAFAPHSRFPIAPTSVTVKVQQPPLNIELSGPEDPAFEANGKDHPPQALPSEEGTALAPSTPEIQLTQPLSKTVKIAVVIDDMGPDLKTSERAILLPPAVTLSFLPYAVRAREQAKDALDKGHEILLHMPMEPFGSEAPGNGALLVDLPLAEIQARFDNALSNIVGFDGVNNHMGSRFTAYKSGMEVILDDMKERNLFFLDSRTSVKSIGHKIAQQKGIPSIERDVFLDDDPSPESIRRQLKAVEQIARSKGYAVAIGHPHLTTIDELELWAATAPQRGIELVPLHDLVTKKRN